MYHKFSQTCEQQRAKDFRLLLAGLIIRYSFSSQQISSTVCHFSNSFSEEAAKSHPAQSLYASDQHKIVAHVLKNIPKHKFWSSLSKSCLIRLLVEFFQHLPKAKESQEENYGVDTSSLILNCWSILLFSDPTCLKDPSPKNRKKRNRRKRKNHSSASQHPQKETTQNSATRVTADLFVDESKSDSKESEHPIASLSHSTISFNFRHELPNFNCWEPATL